MGKDLARAVELYTRGIQVLPKADALFYWSRALCEFVKFLVLAMQAANKINYRLYQHVPT